MNTKALSLIAGAALAAAGVAGTASTASASPSIQISFGGLCFSVGPKAPKHVVRIKAGWKGFYNVQNIRVVPKRYLGRCGVYLSTGRKFGRKYWLVSSLKTGKLLRARLIGFGPGAGYKVPPHVIRNRMIIMGYKNLHMLKYHNFPGLYTVRGWKRYGSFWRLYTVRFSRTGLYTGRTYIKSVHVGVSKNVIKSRMIVMGYKSVHAIVWHNAAQKYTAEGYKFIGGAWRQFRVTFSRTGQYLGRIWI